tara:strand:- start:9739 stop:11988 length:2250 start_codon:yes stop_codon:yes gene_type:complete
MEINFFNRITENKPAGVTSIMEFINNVKCGAWRNLIEPINTEEDKKKRTVLKANTLPYVTISGLFDVRNNNGLKKASGFICLDVDDSENLAEDWEKIVNDKFTFAAFKSASGRGIAVLVKINNKKHLESFLSIENYYLENYKIQLDKSCKDLARPRFVSYDPNAYVNEEAEKYTDFLKKKEYIKKLPTIITGSNDIDYIVDQVKSAGVDLTRGSYKIWLEIGFAIASEYGENGRDYFHAISYYYSEYQHEVCDKQYSKCVKSGGSGVALSTLFYYAKESNLDLVSPETKHIVAAAKQGKKGGRDAAAVINMLEEVAGIKNSEEIVNKVYDSKIDLRLTEDLTELEQMEMFVKNNYNLKRNEITMYIENNGDEIDTRFTNSVWLQCKRVVSDKTPYDTLDKLIGSDFVEDYNPLKEFFETNAHIKPSGLIEELANTIETDTGLKPGDVDPDYKYLFIKKWFVGIIASIYGKHSPLLLVLTGGQRTGKTEFFRRLLPKEIYKYYAESKLDAGKDDEILMTQKILIMDDEMGGKNKQEAKKLKEMTSKDYFTLREPYGRRNVRLKRLAVLCGTSNDETVLNDPTGNRRIIPINILSIKHGLYNSIDKTALLMEAYHLFQSGYNWELTAEDVGKLNRNTFEFEQIRTESELINQFYKTPAFVRPGTTDKVEFFTISEIMIFIEKETGQRLNQWKMGAELKTLGFEQKHKRVNGKSNRVYAAVRVTIEDRAAQMYSDENTNNRLNGDESQTTAF